MKKPLLCIKPKFLTIDKRLDSADEFIAEWHRLFGKRVYNMPHLSTRSLHTTVGVRLRKSLVTYDKNFIDCRDSTLGMQTSGTGKEPTIVFTRKMVSYFPDVRIEQTVRRKNITSAGATGTISDSKFVRGDLQDYLFIACAEADSLFNARIDSFGNDLITDLCVSQDPTGIISKKLAGGSIPEYHSESSLFLMTTIPPAVNARWITKGLFQRFSVVVKKISAEVCQDTANKIIDNLNVIKQDENVDADMEILMSTMSAMPVPENFEIPYTMKPLLKKKVGLLVGKIREWTPKIPRKDLRDSLNSFIIRNTLNMIKYACHHAFLDCRNFVTAEDVEYAYPIADECWTDVLRLFEMQPSQVRRGANKAILELMNDFKKRTLSEIHRDLHEEFTHDNIKVTSQNLYKNGELDRVERGVYQRKRK